LVTAVFTELLKENPDFPAVEAQLAAARATGVEPDMHLLRAESLLSRAQSYARRTRRRGRSRVKFAKRVPMTRRKRQRRTATSHAKRKP